MTREMQVFARHINETIVLTVPGYGPITVKVLKTAASRSTIGVDAPNDVRVVRGERVDGPPPVAFSQIQKAVRRG